MWWQTTWNLNTCYSCSPLFIDIVSQLLHNSACREELSCVSIYSKHYLLIHICFDGVSNHYQAKVLSWSVDWPRISHWLEGVACVYMNLKWLYVSCIYPPPDCVDWVLEVVMKISSRLHHWIVTSVILTSILSELLDKVEFRKCATLLNWSHSITTVDISQFLKGVVIAM